MSDNKNGKKMNLKESFCSKGKNEVLTLYSIFLLLLLVN